MKIYNRIGYIDSSFLTINHILKYFKLNCSFKVIKQCVINYPSYPFLNIRDLHQLLQKEFDIKYSIKKHTAGDIIQKYSVFFLKPYEGAFILFLEEKDLILRFKHPYAGLIELSRKSFASDCHMLYLEIDKTSIPNHNNDMLLEEQEISEQTEYLSKHISITPNFLKIEECNYLIWKIEKERKRLLSDNNGEISKVNFSIGLNENEGISSEIRRKIMSKIWDLLPSEFYDIDALIVVRYSENQRNSLHYDILNEQEGKNIYSFIIYLNDNFSGGETYFPQLDYKVSPQKGNMLLFRSIDDNSAAIDCSVHAGLPIQKGVKYTCNIWLKNKK